MKKDNWKTDTRAFQEYLARISDQGKPLHRLLVQKQDFFPEEDKVLIRRQMMRELEDHYANDVFKGNPLHQLQFIPLKQFGVDAYLRFSTLDVVVLDKLCAERQKENYRIARELTNKIKTEASKMSGNYRSEMVKEWLQSAKRLSQQKDETIKQQLIRDIVGHYSDTTALLVVCCTDDMQTDPFYFYHTSHHIKTAQKQAEYLKKKAEQATPVMGESNWQQALSGQQYLPKPDEEKPNIVNIKKAEQS